MGGAPTTAAHSGLGCSVDQATIEYVQRSSANLCLIGPPFPLTPRPSESGVSRGGARAKAVQAFGDLVVHVASKPWLELCGLTQDECVGKPAKELHGPLTSATHIEQLRKFCDTHLHNSDETFGLNAGASPMTQKGEEEAELVIPEIVSYRCAVAMVKVTSNLDDDAATISRAPNKEDTAASRVSETIFSSNPMNFLRVPSTHRRDPIPSTVPAIAQAKFRGTDGAPMQRVPFKSKLLVRRLRSFVTNKEYPLFLARIEHPQDVAGDQLEPPVAGDQLEPAEELINLVD